MEKMGDKLMARKIMTEAKVPIIPGSLEALKNAKDAKKIAKKVGYPVMIKPQAAAAGAASAR